MSRRRICLTLIGGASLLVMAATVTRAQAQDAAGPDAAPSTADAPSKAATAEPKVQGPPERIIYLPYKQIGDVFDQSGSSVIMPYGEYLRLWSAMEDGDGQPGAKVDAVITHAKYVATVEQDIARIQAELTVQVVGKPWVEVPLDFGEAAVGKLTSTTGDVLLRGTGKGTYVLLLKEQGEQKVSLELTARITTSPNGREIEFKTPSVAVTTFELLVPQADQEVEIRPRLVQQSVEAPEGKTRVTANLGATPQISAKWHARASMKPQMDLLASVNNRQRVSIADGLIHTEARLEYEVLRGELEQVRIAVPRGHRILDVTASTRVQRWQTAEQNNQQVVTVELLTPATETLTVDVHTEAKLGDGDVSVAGIAESGVVNGVHALDVVRESGQLVVTHGDDLTLRVTHQSGLVRIEADDVAKSIQAPGALAYKFFSPQFGLTVAVSPVTPRVTIEHVARIEVREDQLLLDTSLSYVVERSGLFDIRIALPDGLEITGVDSDPMDEYRVEDDTLVVVLSQKVLGPFTVTVRGEQPLPADGDQFDLPLLEPLNVERERGTVLLTARESIELTTNEDGLVSALPEVIGTGRVADLRASWRFARRPVRIPVTITRKPTRLSAQVATAIDVQPTRTRVTTHVDFVVEYAGQEVFRIDIPESAMETLQIEAIASRPTSPALRETTTVEPADGWVTHTLTMQRPVTGRQRFRITYDLQPTEEEPVDEAGDDNDADSNATADDDNGPATPPAEGTTPANTLEPSDDSSSDKQPSTDDSDNGGANNGDANSNDATGNDDEAGEVVDADNPKVERPVGKTIALRIIRPLGNEADGTQPATPLTHTTGEVQLTHEESLTITAHAEGADVEPIDVRELRTLPTRGTLAFRYRRHNADETISVAVTQTRYDVQELLATVVSRALVEVMLGDDPTATYRCRYRIKSTERQRLEIRLPQGMELLSALVNETDVRLEPHPLPASEKWGSYFINVARSGESDETFTVSLQFLLTFDQPPFDASWGRGRVELPLPVIGNGDGSTATQQLRTIVWVPREFALIGNPTGFVLDGYTSLITAALGGPKRIFPGQDNDDWIGCRSSGGLDFPTAGREHFQYTNLGGKGQIKLLWWDTVKVTIVVSLTFAVMALVLLRTGWENKLGILLLIAFGAVLLGLKNMHVLAHGLSTMRIGLAFMVGLWVIHGLFGERTPDDDGGSPSKTPGVTSGTPPYAATVPPPGLFDDFGSKKADGDDDFR